MGIHKCLPVLAMLFDASLLMGGNPAHALGRFHCDIGGQTVGSSFVISLAVPSRFVRRDDYFILTYVTIVDQDGNIVDEFLSDPHPIVVRGNTRGNQRNEDGLFEIASQLIPWDPDGYTGLAGVGVLCQIFDRKGRPVRNMSAEAFEVVEIRSAEEGEVTSTLDGVDGKPAGLAGIDPQSIQWDHCGFYFGPSGIAVVKRMSDEADQDVTSTGVRESGVLESATGDDSPG